MDGTVPAGAAILLDFICKVEIGKVADVKGRLSHYAISSSYSDTNLGGTLKV